MTAGGAATIAAQDPRDPIMNGQIDLGALAAEFLALNLDLYPRKPGVTFENMLAAKCPEQIRPSLVYGIVHNNI